MRARDSCTRHTTGSFKFKAGEKNGDMDHRKTWSPRVQRMDMKFVPGPQGILEKRMAC